MIDPPEVLVTENSSVCIKCESLVDAYLDGELPTLETIFFDTHLEICEKCRSLVSNCDAILKAAHSLKDKPIPRDVCKRLRNVLNEKLKLNLGEVGPKLTVLKNE